MTGDAMAGIGIFNEDVVLVDRAIKPEHGSIVLAIVNNEYMIRRLYKRKDSVKLVPENENFYPIEMSGQDELTIWGVVTASIRKHL